MNCICRIEQLPELEPSGLEEPPKRPVYVYYCGVCNSVLDLSEKMDRLQSFLYTAADECPTCHFQLESVLRCRVLNLRLPIELTRGCTIRPPLRLNMGRSTFPTLELAPSRTSAGTFVRGRESSESQAVSFGVDELDEICGGVHVGQMIVLYGGRVCQRIAEQLCIRSQLPIISGGLDATSAFIDGGNALDAYHISNYARTLHLDHDQALRRIMVSRAFTCYQLANLIIDKLPQLLCEEKVGLVVVGNLLDMFMDPDIKLREAKQTINFLSHFLAQFARENEIALVVTCPARKDNRDAFLRQYLTGRAQVVLRAEQRNHAITFVLEKHPTTQPVSLAITPSLGAVL